MLAPNVWAHSNHEKTADKPKLTDILHNDWQVLFKSVKVMEYREDQGDRTVTCNVGSWIDPESEKDISRETGDIWRRLIFQLIILHQC